MLLWDVGFYLGLGRERGRRKWEGGAGGFELGSDQGLSGETVDADSFCFVDGGGIWVVGKESLDKVIRYERMGGRMCFE